MKSLFVFSCVLSAAFACSGASADILTINTDSGNTYEAELDTGYSGVCDMDGGSGECEITDESDDIASLQLPSGPAMVKLKSLTHMAIPSSWM